jgi:hypothetical protein
VAFQNSKYGTFINIFSSLRRQKAGKNMVDFRFPKLHTRVRFPSRSRTYLISAVASAPPRAPEVGFEDCGRSSMVEPEFSKLTTRVRFPSPAPEPPSAGKLRDCESEEWLVLRNVNKPF